MSQALAKLKENKAFFFILTVSYQVDVLVRVCGKFDGGGESARLAPPMEVCLAKAGGKAVLASPWPP